MNKYKNDNEKLEKRQKIVKKEISSTLAKKEKLKRISLKSTDI